MFKIKLNRLFIGILLALCFVFGFIPNQVSAKTSSDKKIETNLETSPSNPKGQNDWYTSVTLIELESNSNGKTYFQWNETNGEWKEYKQPIRAWRGENTLYYYSISRGGTKEAVKSRTFKVDYVKPVIEKIETKSIDGAASINIKSKEEISSYKIYKKFDESYRFVDTVSNDVYVDKDVKVGQTYVYKVVAFDSAGLKSSGMQAVVKIVEPVVVPISLNIEVAKAEKEEIKPQIAQGASIVSNSSSQKIEEPKETETVVTISEEQPSAPIKNWNRLFIAISILVVAIGASIGGYYGYEWWAKRSEVKDKPKEKKSSSRW